MNNILNNKKTRSEIVMESYLGMRVPEIHRQGLRSIYAPRPQKGKGASWMGRKQEIKK